MRIRIGGSRDEAYGRALQHRVIGGGRAENDELAATGCRRGVSTGDPSADSASHHDQRLITHQVARLAVEVAEVIHNDGQQNDHLGGSDVKKRLSGRSSRSRRLGGPVSGSCRATPWSRVSASSGR